MNRLFFTLLLVFFGFKSISQDFSLTPNEVETSKKQAENLIQNYERSLNNLGSNQTTVQEKEYFVTDILHNFFEGEDVLVYNDLDPENKESKNLTIKTYLNNIITKYYKGLKVNFSDIKVSNPYYLNDRNFFIKVDLASNLEGTHIDQPVNTFEAVDLYLKFEINELYNITEPVIYSIAKHAENLDQFKPVTVDQGSGSINFTFINPGKKKKFRRGKEYVLEWKGDAKTPVRVELYRGDKSMFVINPVVAGNKLRWDVPRKLDRGRNYKIRITNLKAKENFKDSPYFSIKRKVPTGLKLLGVGAVAGIVYFVLSQSEEPGDESLPSPPLPQD